MTQTMPRSLGEAIHGPLSEDFDGLNQPDLRSKLAAIGATDRVKLARCGPEAIYKDLSHGMYSVLISYMKRSWMITWPDAGELARYSQASASFYATLDEYTRVPNSVMTTDQAVALQTALRENNNPSLNDIARMSPEDIKKLASHHLMSDFTYSYLYNRVAEVKPIVDMVDKIMSRTQIVSRGK